MTTLPDGPLFSTCTEAAISSFGLGGGTVSSNERQIIDGNFGACPRCAKSRSGGGPSAYIIVSSCMARTLASPLCLWCSAVWVEVGNANVAFLTFIPCTVTSILTLVSSPQRFWPSTEHMPNPFACIVIHRSTASQKLDCYACSAILHCLLVVNFSVSSPGPTYSRVPAWLQLNPTPHF